MHNNIYAETPRMILRNFVSEDASDLHEILGDDDTMEHCEPAYKNDRTVKIRRSYEEIRYAARRHTAQSDKR